MISPVQHRLMEPGLPLRPGNIGNNAFTRKEEKPKIKPVLEKALADTLNGKLDWRHARKQSGQEQTDTFFATRNNTTLQLTATRPISDIPATPSLLGRWELKLDKPGKRPAILDGGQLHLPDAVSGETDKSEKIIPKLFKSVYEASAQQHDPLRTVIEDFRDKLTRGEMTCSLSRIKPDFRYNLPTGAKIIQVGEGDERLEISRIGHNLRIKVHRGKQVERHSELALQNTDVRNSLDALLQEVHLQRTGKQGKGLDGF